MVDAAMDMDVEVTVMSSMDSSKKTLKRKRESSITQDLSPEERESWISALKGELKGLFEYYAELITQRERFDCDTSFYTSLNALTALFMEGKQAPLSKLVNEIYAKVKERMEDVTSAAVKKAVHLVGQRVMYGIPRLDADVFEDETETCLWCWEVRDLKFIPKSMRGSLKVWRTCRKMIHDRITVVSSTIAALENYQNKKVEMTRASEKLGKVLGVGDISIYLENMLQKNEKEGAEKDLKQKEKILIKQLERNKREAEKERQRMEKKKAKEMLHQKRQIEKEQKRLQEMEKEEKRREESEMRKQSRKQQDEAEKEHRRREKEQAELRKQLAIQKQASIMERFLKTGKMPSSGQNERPSSKPTSLGVQDGRETVAEAATLSIDCALQSDAVTNIDDLRKLHFSAWQKLGRLMRLNSYQHWGRRRKPKIELFRELKLSSSSGIVQDDELRNEKSTERWGEKHSRDAYIACSDPSASDVGCRRKKQLLQFDKCYRPAFYGVWPKHSQVVGPCHPFRKDPELDYDVDSDEEWEEEEPGESLSDCEKDEEESVDAGCLKVDEEDESEDGFFVPDGYLSDDEGVQLDRSEVGSSPEASRSSENSKAELENEEFGLLLCHQRHLNNLTEQALRKNQPLIITNLRHEKIPLLVAEDLCGTSKMEKACLEALSLRLFPGGHNADVSVSKMHDEHQESSLLNVKDSPQPVSAVRVKDADLPLVVSVIQSCPQGINKVVEVLQEKLPEISKTQLRNTVREISDFKDNRWQVRRDVQLRLGFSPSPDKSSSRPKNITSFFSKRCLPPSCKVADKESLGTQEESDKAKAPVQQSPWRSNDPNNM